MQLYSENPVEGTTINMANKEMQREKERIGRLEAKEGGRGCRDNVEGTIKRIKESKCNK